MNHRREARVAIVIPVYNAEGFIKDTVISVLGQTYQDYVLIAVNDGSTDHSADFLQSVTDNRLLLVNQPNSGGPAKPRNVGIALSASEYVAFFDSDDLMKPEKIAVAVQVLDACPDAAFAFSNFSLIDEKGENIMASFLEGYPEFNRLIDSLPKAEGYVYIPSGPLFETLFKENFIGTSSIVVRRTVLNIVGDFDESLRNSDDRDMWFRLARIFGAAYIPKVLHQYRKREGSISSRSARVNAENRIKVLRKQLVSGVSRSSKKYLLAQIAGNHASVGYAERKLGNRTASAKAFLRAFIVKPRLRFLLASAKSALDFQK